MPMSRDRLGYFVCLLLVLCAVGPAAAQSGSAAGSADSGAPKPTLPGGASALEEAHGDWRVVCVPRPDRTQCTLSQQLLDANSHQRVLALELSARAADRAEGLLAMPFGLRLSSGVTFQIDDETTGPAQPFNTCVPAGCLVPVMADAAMLGAFRRGTALNLTAVAVDSGQTVRFRLSLNGFTTAFARTLALSQ